MSSWWGYIYGDWMENYNVRCCAEYDTSSLARRTIQCPPADAWHSRSGRCRASLGRQSRVYIYSTLLSSCTHLSSVGGVLRWWIQYIYFEMSDDVSVVGMLVAVTSSSMLLSRSRRLAVYAWCVAVSTDNSLCVVLEANINMVAGHVLPTRVNAVS